MRKMSRIRLLNFMLFLLWANFIVFQVSAYGTTGEEGKKPVKGAEPAEEEEEEGASGMTEKCAVSTQEEVNVLEFASRAENEIRAAIDACRQAQWEDLINSSKTTEANVGKTLEKYNKLYTKLRNELLGLLKYYPNYTNAALVYWVRTFLYASPTLLDDTRVEYNEMLGKLDKIMHQKILCPFGVIDDPEMCILTTLDFDDISHQYHDNYEEILYYWKTPKDVLGQPSAKNLYTELVGQWQIAAEIEGYPDAMSLDLETSYLEPTTGRDDMITLWGELKELYAEFFFFMNSKMTKVHKNLGFSVDDFGLAPMEFYGSHPMNFGFMPNKTNPYYRSKKRIKLEDVIEKEGLTPTQFAYYADDLLVSMGLEPMTEDFWENSYFEEIEGRGCSSNFVYRLDKKRTYVGTCLDYNIFNLQEIYHKIAEVEYLKLMDLNEVTNSYNYIDFYGWQNRIADGISPILLSPSYLAQLGIIKENAPEQTFLYYMFQQYANVIPQMVYAMETQLWIWRIYNNEIQPEDFNCELYKTTAEHQGMRPPEPRPAELFDAIIRRRLIDGPSYKEWFFGYIIKFQVFQSLCQAAGHEGPLYTCNFYGSKEAGKLLREIMSLGASSPSNELLQKVFGSSFNVGGIIEYFTPVIEMIKSYNDKKNTRIPWTIEGAESLLCAPAGSIMEDNE